MKDIIEEIENDLKSENYEVTVMATMSSGKSTLLNALIGYNLVPSKNEACTAKILKITDNDELTKFEGFALKKDGQKIISADIDIEVLSKWNDNRDIEYISIEGDLKGIDNVGKNKIVFIDTPGPNNSQDSTHAKITHDIIEKNNFGTILYVLNSTNIAAEDDKELVSRISAQMSKSNFNQNKILFVLNKVDNIDVEKEGSISNVINNIKMYLEKNGIKNPVIIPLSAYSAKLFKMTLENIKMTKKEEADFIGLFDMFSDEMYDMMQHTNVDNRIKDIIETSKIQYKESIKIGANEYSKSDIYVCLKKTGIMVLEEIFNMEMNKEETKVVSLKKGEKVELTKGNPGLNRIFAGLGWDTSKYSSAYDFDLDTSVFLLGEKGKVLRDSDFIFYNNLEHDSKAVRHCGDDLKGGSGGDDEKIFIDLSKIPENIHKIAFTVTINDGKERGQDFGQVTNAYIRVVDEYTGKEIIRYNLGEEFSIETAIVVGEIYRHNGEWKFNAIGGGFQGGLAALCNNFGVEI